MNIKVEFSETREEVVAAAFHAIAEAIEAGGMIPEDAGTKVIGIAKDAPVKTTPPVTKTPPAAKTPPAKTPPAAVTPPVEEATDEDDVDFSTGEDDYTPTKDELKALIAQKANKEKKREEVGAILASVNATNVVTIEQQYYASVWSQLNAL